MRGRVQLNAIPVAPPAVSPSPPPNYNLMVSAALLDMFVPPPPVRQVRREPQRLEDMLHVRLQAAPPPPFPQQLVGAALARVRKPTTPRRSAVSKTRAKKRIDSRLPSDCPRGFRPLNGFQLRNHSGFSTPTNASFNTNSTLLALRQVEAVISTNALRLGIARPAVTARVVAVIVTPPLAYRQLSARTTPALTRVWRMQALHTEEPAMPAAGSLSEAKQALLASISHAMETDKATEAWSKEPMGGLGPASAAVPRDGARPRFDLPPPRGDDISQGGHCTGL